MLMSRSGLEMAARAASTARFSPLARPIANQRLARFAHDLAHVREVEIDVAGHGYDFRDALDRLAEHFVADTKGFRDGHVRRANGKEAVVWNDDERVHFVPQMGNAFLGLKAALRALEGEGLRHDADG